jgi:hypothetical protein
MKRVVILVLVGLLAAASGAFALKSAPDFAIGAEMTDVNINNLGAMVNLHFPGLPLYFAVGADFGAGVTLTSSLDVWLIHSSMGAAGYFSWYLGLGAYGAVGLNPAWLGIGARLPIGIQIWPLKNERLEFFVELAPAWVPLYGDVFDPLRFQAQMALGFRVWTELGK